MGVLTPFCTQSIKKDAHAVEKIHPRNECRLHTAVSCSGFVPAVRVYIDEPAQRVNTSVKRLVEVLISVDASRFHAGA